MLIDITFIAAESERHRAALLADAETFRLARLVRRARRRRRAEPPRSESPPPDRSGHTAAARNDDAERRYAVSR